MGLREEKMSIKLILLERMKGEAAQVRLALVALWEVCVRVRVPTVGSSRPLGCHQQGQVEGHTRAPTRHQCRTCAPPSQTSPPPHAITQ